MADDSVREVEFCPFGAGRLADMLGLKVLPFARQKEPFRQLDYIQAYVSDLLEKYAGSKDAPATILIETHYIDRDYIEDHSVFYSRNLFPYRNFCRRIHFFAMAEDDLRKKIRAAAASRRESDDAYRTKCSELSQSAYLGFCVLKPLDGCPVGRTVLRTFPKSENGKLYRRDFQCIREYKIHLLGVELSVKGLAFQQQDAGVAACATTAIWSSLHHLRSFEDFAAATPAQITALASQNNLPYGRPMPSEGLSLGQMCQAIQAVGVSPAVIKLEDFKTAGFYLHAAARSGMAPILVIARGDLRHAVTVAGVKIKTNAQHDFVEGIDDASIALEGLYVHDDRMGPYLQGEFVKIVVKEKDKEKERAGLRLGRENPVEWVITHVLLAVHPKIRLSLKGLRDAGIEFAKTTQALVQAFFKEPKPEITLETRVVRGFKYVEELIADAPVEKVELAETLSRKVAMPRYVGLVRLTSAKLGIIDLLVDTTGTPRNLHAIGVVSFGASTEFTDGAVRFLAKRFKAQYFV